MVGIVLIGCQKTEVLQEEDVFFPLIKGNANEYEVSEISYGILSGKQEKNYFLKEIVGDSVGQIGQNTIYKIERYKRQNLASVWKIDSVWAAYLTPDRAVKIENNIPFLKIRFPILNGNTWNGNQYNSLGTEQYFLKTLSKIQLNDKSFRAIEIIQESDSSAVELRRKKEIYLNTKGLYYQEKTNFQYCQSTPACIGKGIIESGYSIKIQAIN